ncbi:MAG: hypothetical protein QXN59_03055 [Candidatus Micrarchaeaceae archaeon]
MYYWQSKGLEKHNAPIASLQEAYRAVSREISPCVVIGNWALRLSLFDNASWDTSFIELALVRRPKEQKLKNMGKGFAVLKEIEYTSCGACKFVLSKQERGYEIPLVLKYDTQGKKYMHGIPSQYTYLNSIEMELPAVRIANKKVALSYELLAARDARLEGDILMENAHTYNAYRILGGLYGFDAKEFIAGLSLKQAKPVRHMGILRASDDLPEAVVNSIKSEALRLESLIRREGRLEPPGHSASNKLE